MASGNASRILYELSLSAIRVAVRAATSGSARNLSAQTGANTAMTALSELVPANFSAVVRLMKPKPYESSIIPTTTPPAPVHREGFATSQLIVMGHSSSSREATFYALDRRKSEQNCSVHSAISVRQRCLSLNYSSTCASEVRIISTHRS